jgi:hypothetical protein
LRRAIRRITSYIFERQREIQGLANETGKEEVAATLGTGAGAPSYEEDAFAVAEVEDGLDFGGGGGEELMTVSSQSILRKVLELRAKGPFQWDSASFTTVPPFITNLTCCRTEMSVSGSPSTAIRSA